MGYVEIGSRLEKPVGCSEVNIINERPFGPRKNVGCTEVG